MQRDKREFYKKKKNLIGKKSSLLPSVQAEMGKSVFNDNKIHIKESLTIYRKRLFGRINAFKQQHNHKFLWNTNGKILLRETETPRIVSFSTHEEFEVCLEQINNRWVLLFQHLIIICIYTFHFIQTSVNFLLLMNLCWTLKVIEIVLFHYCFYRFIVRAFFNH